MTLRTPKMNRMLQRIETPTCVSANPHYKYVFQMEIKWSVKMCHLLLHFGNVDECRQNSCGESKKSYYELKSNLSFAMESNLNY